MKFRKPTTKDKEQIANVLLTGYNMDSIKEALQFYLDDLSQGMNYVVAEDKNKIIGLITWKMHDIPKHQLAELHKVCVIPEHRGKGVSKQLFQALIKDANNYYKKHNHKLRKLYLMTHKSNTAAIKYYEKMGFKIEATLPNHYYDGEDELVLSMFF